MFAFSVDELELFFMPPPMVYKKVFKVYLTV